MARKYLQQIIEENFPKIKKEIVMNVQETHNTKQIGPEKKILPSNNNQSTKFTEQSILKVVREKAK